MPEAYNDAELLAAQRAERQARYDAQIAAARTEDPEPDTAHLTSQAIASCRLCDGDGYRPNGTVCDHVDRAATSRAGIARVRAALTNKQLRLDEDSQ